MISHNHFHWILIIRFFLQIFGRGPVLLCLLLRASLVAQLVKNACNSGDPGLIPGSGRSAGKGNGYPLKYSGLENSADCIVHGVEGGCFALICLLLKSN